MKAFLIILAASSFALCSCSENSNKKSTTVASPFKESPLDAVYTPIRPKVQSFTIDNSRSNTITAANGTQLLIPADCFTTLDGDPVKGTVQVEVIETASLKDF